MCISRCVRYLVHWGFWRILATFIMDFRLRNRSLDSSSSSRKRRGLGLSFCSPLTLLALPCPVPSAFANLLDSPMLVVHQEFSEAVPGAGTMIAPGPPQARNLVRHFGGAVRRTAAHLIHHDEFSPLCQCGLGIFVSTTRPLMGCDCGGSR